MNASEIEHLSRKLEHKFNVFAFTAGDETLEMRKGLSDLAKCIADLAEAVAALQG